ncbi:MAG: efflux RND transporter periplasmic adaptor subunit [Micavibrio sp.]|nr:efflux RND transporter periplasmic adaptor subunit [Micavibrio sp.]
MKELYRNMKLFPVLLVMLALSTNAFAHGGEIEVGSGARGPVHLSKEQQAAIDVKTAVAESRSMASLLNINGEAQLLPDHQADIDVKFSGQIKQVYANLGDTVQVGQRLALVEGRLIGSNDVTIVAPVSGVIDARHITLGQGVEPGTKLFHISDRAQMLIVGKVYEESLSKIAVGQDARVHFLAYPEKALQGKVTLLEPNLDASSRTVKIWIQLENPDGLLVPNMFAHVGIVLRKNDAALTIPNDAIIEAGGEKFVFVRSGDTFNRVEVTVGASDDEYTEVTDGLVPGDEVATQGSRQIYTMWLTGGQMKSEDD